MKLKNELESIQTGVVIIPDILRVPSSYKLSNFHWIWNMHHFGVTGCGIQVAEESNVFLFKKKKYFYVFCVCSGHFSSSKFDLKTL